MIKFLFTLFLFTSLALYSQEAPDRKISFADSVYDPFFSATITDNEGETFSVSRMAFFDEYNEKKFFFWVRRNSGLYSLNFKNIKGIMFSGDDFSDDRYLGFTRGTLELVSGETHTIYLKTTGHIEGFDEEFGAPVTFYLHYNLIESIEFHHTGVYKYCPFCETIYFGDEHDTCIYDKTPLIKGVLSESER